MCWNASVSMNTYLLGLFATTLALSNGVITALQYAYYQSFMLMQLVEYFIWSYPSLNRVMSQVGLLLVIAQPALSVLLTRDKRYVPALLLAYAACIAVLFVAKPWSSIDFTSTRASNGHLAWNWLDFPVALMVVWVSFYFVRFAIDAEWVWLVISVGLVATIVVLYGPTRTWGSLWCWIVNLIALVLLYQVFKKDICLQTA
jgi:hypothetical protein